jgi:hypothetical protein
MTETWQKYEYVCTYCDGLFTYTIKDLTTPETPCPMCKEFNLTLMSVLDATIYPTTKKEEQTMETATPQTMVLTWIENDVPTTKKYTESEVRQIIWSQKKLTENQNEWFRKESQLRTLLEEVYADSEDQDSLSRIAEIFDVPLTKEIEVTIYVRVDATVEVDLTHDYMDNLEDFISSNLTVDSYGSELSVNNHEIERVEEGSY